MRRFHYFLAGTVVLGSFLFFVIPAAVVRADCLPPPTGGDDTITCTGTYPGTLNAGDGNDTVTNQGTINVDLDGGPGNDTLNNYGTVGDDIEGGDGDDTVNNYGTVNDDVRGGDGDDLLHNQATGVIGQPPNTRANLEGRDGDDTIINDGTVLTVITGGWGNDAITNNGTAGSVNGDFNNDVITNNGTVTGDLNGGSDNDLIVHNGTVGGDLLGSTGNDSIIVNGHVEGTVDAGRDGDIVILQNGATGNSGGNPNTLLLDGGDDNDELRFDLTVGNAAEEQRLHNQIATADPANGSLSFGSQVFQWLNFERLVDMVRLVFVPTAQPAPAAPEPDPCILNDGVNLAVCRYPNGDVAFLRLKNGEGRLHSYLSVDALYATPPGGVVIDQTDDEGYRLRVVREPEGDFLIEMYAPGAGTDDEFLEQSGPEVQPMVVYRLPL